MRITVDSDTALVNGKESHLDVPARIVNDKTLVPLRFISESLGFIVDWDEDNHKASVYSE